LVKVRKRMEEFDKAKLELSMEKAGAEEAHARKVADKIAGKVKEGTSTAKIWEWVIQELKPLDPKAAKAYRTYRTRIARALSAFHREEKGVVARLPPERTVARLVRLFVASIDTVGSFLRQRMGESGLQSMFEYQGERFGEGWEKLPWKADQIAKNMIRLNFQPFGIEARYTGDEKKATIVVSKCPLPERFLQSLEFLHEMSHEHPVSIKGEEMFASVDKAKRSLDWPPRKTEVCATCRIVMPNMGKRLGFSWKHTAIKGAPPKCVFDIEMTKRQKQT